MNEVNKDSIKAYYEKSQIKKDLILNLILISLILVISFVNLFSLIVIFFNYSISITIVIALFILAFTSILVFGLVKKKSWAYQIVIFFTFISMFYSLEI